MGLAEGWNFNSWMTSIREYGLRVIASRDGGADVHLRYGYGGQVLSAGGIGGLASQGFRCAPPLAIDCPSFQDD